VRGHALTRSSRATASWLLAWCLAIVLLGAYVWHGLRLSGDLRLFLPDPSTPEQRMLLEGVGEGPAARLLLVAIEGASEDKLARASRELAALLRGRDEFVRVENGASGLDTVPESLFAYRYLLSPTLDVERLEEGMLRRELTARLRDLASPAGPVLEALLPRDPTLEMLRLADYWTPDHEPERVGGVWFDPEHARALLLVQTGAAGFDPDGQQRALTVLQDAFGDVAAGTGMRLVVSGPGTFSAIMKERTQSEAEQLGMAATFGLLLLLALAYRRTRVILLGLLPLASAALVGLASVSLLFGDVHGITLAFGFTLIGVAQDYPMHLFSHQRRGLDPDRNARELWPTMRTGVASTCIAYLAFIVAGAQGLAQLGVFSISGLAVAGLATRYLLPRIIGEDYRDNGGTHEMEAAWRLLSRVPARPGLVAGVLTAASVAALLVAPGPFWDDDLGRLTPVPRNLLEQDMELRRAIGAPDVRYLVGLRGSSAEDVLRRLERLGPALDAAVTAGILDGFDHAARYLPSREMQRLRQSRLPALDSLRVVVSRAQQGLPFREGVFDPFVADVARARALDPLGPGDLAGTPLAGVVETLLREQTGEWVATVTLAGVHDPAALAGRIAEASAEAVFVDLKQASVGLVVAQRDRMLWTLGLAALLLAGVVRFALGEWRRSRTVLMPMAVTTVAVVGALHGLGQPLNLFHLIALVLAAGLGLDYALFFERAAPEAAEQRRTLHGVLVCAASTLMVFVLLSFSSIPVLRSIGVTVSLGVVGNFLLALLVTRNPRGPSHAAR
jgi:predicted exporter